MALPAYLAIRGERQGPILGPLTKDGREGLIRVIGVFHSIVAPRNPRTGQAIGKRIHKPLTLVKRIDATSPQFYTLLCTNEMVSSMELRFYAPRPDGTEFNDFTITLRDARIVRMELKYPNAMNPRLARLGAREEIGFIYGTIEWANAKPAIVTADEWDNPR
jgi:type VI secretion system secreted protein Hcp